MTDPELTKTQQLIKTDILGRVRTSSEQREKILDAFESSGMSGQAFAIHHGIKVPTFASWIQKRRRKRGDYDDEAKRRKLHLPSKIEPPLETNKTSPPTGLSLIEVQIRPEQDEQTTRPLEVILPSGAVIRIASESQISLLKILLRELPC